MANKKTQVVRVKLSGLKAIVNEQIKRELILIEGRKNKKPLVESKKSNGKKENLNEGLRDVIKTGLMSLAMTIGGQAMAQTQGTLPIDTNSFKKLVIKGYDKADITIKKVQGDKITYRVINDLGWQSDMNDAEKSDVDNLGIVVKDNTKQDGTFVIAAGDTEGSGGVFDKIKQKYGNEVSMNQKIEILIGQDLINKTGREGGNIVSLMESKKKYKSKLNENQNLNEGLRDLVLGGMMSLAAFMNLNAQTTMPTSSTTQEVVKDSSYVANPTGRISIGTSTPMTSLNLVGYDKGDIKIKKVKGSGITYRVVNNISGGNINSQTEAELEKMLGILVNNQTNSNGSLTIYAGDSHGKGSLFDKVKNKFGQDVNINQTIELLVGEDSMGQGFKFNVQ